MVMLWYVLFFNLNIQFYFVLNYWCNYVAKSKLKYAVNSGVFSIIFFWEGCLNILKYHYYIWYVSYVPSFRNKNKNKITPK